MNPALELTFSQFRLMGITELPIDVWLDGQDRLVRVTMRFSLPSGEATNFINYFDLNSPYVITAPDPSIVVMK